MLLSRAPDCPDSDAFDIPLIYLSYVDVRASCRNRSKSTEELFGTGPNCFTAFIEATVPVYYSLCTQGARRMRTL